MTAVSSARATEFFWGEIAPCEHSLQLYEEEDALLDSLEGFVSNGITLGEGVVVIATPMHLLALHSRLGKKDIDLRAAKDTDQYIPLDAQETLSQFMVNGWPDEDRFNEVVQGLLTRAGSNGRKVRAFGEMVAIMWARGENEATIRLEHLWNKLCASEKFSLFCAYPAAGFAQDAVNSIQDICDAHSRIIGG